MARSDSCRTENDRWRHPPGCRRMPRSASRPDLLPSSALGWYCADEHGLGHPLRTVTANVARDFTAACRVAYVDGIIQVERFHKRRKVVGVGVHLVAVPGLARPA